MENYPKSQMTEKPQTNFKYTHLVTWMLFKIFCVREM